MQLLSSTITVDAPADHVWDILAHGFDRIGEWATVIPSSAAATSSTPLEPARLDGPVEGVGGLEGSCHSGEVVAV